MARNSFLYADVPLRNYSLTLPLLPSFLLVSKKDMVGGMVLNRMYGEGEIRGTGYPRFTWQDVIK